MTRAQGFCLVLLLTSPTWARGDLGYLVSTVAEEIAEEQTVLPAYLRHPDRADLVVLSSLVDGSRKGAVYGLSELFQYDAAPIATFEVPADVVLVDTGRWQDRDTLVFFTADRAIRFDPFTESVQQLARIDSAYRVPVAKSLPRLDIFRDMNEDGLDDLMIPGFTGYTLYLQLPDGHFDDGTSIAAPPAMEMSFDQQPWYQSRILFSADMTLDGLTDIVCWVDDAFRIFPRLPNGRYAADFLTRPSPVPLEFDGVELASYDMRDEDQSDLDQRSLYQVRDLDGDSLPELITLNIRSEGVFRKQSTYEVYRGQRGPDKTLTFTTEPVSVIRSNGIQFGLVEHDLNADGQLDMVISSVQLGIGKIVGALLTGSISFDLNFYRMDAGVYPSKPDIERPVTATFNLSSGDFFLPFVLIGEVNGDAAADLLVQDGNSLFNVYEGVPGAGLFQRQGKSVSLDLPSDPDLVELVDLNADGRQDLVFTIERLDKRNKVSVVIFE
ncbi:MAG: FG-GAP repeat domain-containing protein [Pseudomonadota bacterium]